MMSQHVAVEALAAIDHPRTIIVLDAMLSGRLYYRKKDQRIVIADPAEKGFAISDAITGEDLGEAGKRKVKRISLNNQLRTVLRTAIARLSLGNPDPEVRLAAVRQMIDNFETLDNVGAILTVVSGK